MTGNRIVSERRNSEGKQTDSDQGGVREMGLDLGGWGDPEEVTPE